VKPAIGFVGAGVGAAACVDTLDASFEDAMADGVTGDGAGAVGP